MKRLRAAGGDNPNVNVDEVQEVVKENFEADRHRAIEEWMTNGTFTVTNDTVFMEYRHKLYRWRHRETAWHDIGVQFRRKGDDKGYLVVFGYNETPKVILGDLADGCCPSGQCLSECGCENGGKEILGVDHGLGGGLTQDNSVPYFGRVEVKGSNVKVWYMELAKVKDLFADSSTLGAPVLESDKATYKSAGTVDVWHESWGMGRIDSILVTSGAGFDVDVKDKLTTTWSEIKTTY